MGWIILELWEESPKEGIQIAYAYDDSDTAPYETLREDVERIISVTDEGVEHSPRDQIRELLRDAGFERGLTGQDNDRAIGYSREGGSRQEAIESDVELILQLDRLDEKGLEIARFKPSSPGIHAWVEKMRYLWSWRHPRYR